MTNPQSKAKRVLPEAGKIAKRKLKGLLLYVFPIPLLLAALVSLFSADIFKMLGLFFAACAYLLAASLARRGFKQEALYQDKSIARAPTVPLKTLAAIIIATTTGLLALFATSNGFLTSIAIAGICFIGFVLAYGLDPRQHKSGDLGRNFERTLNAIQVAESEIKRIETAGSKINNPALRPQFARIVRKAKTVLRTIEQDPTRLSSARKFLKVYLVGAARVTESYAQSQQSAPPPAQLHIDFCAALDSIEKTFEEEDLALRSNQHFDLDVQIQVLERQLNRDD